MSVFAFAIGLFLGIVSGLIPGVHPNLVVSLVDSLGIENGTASLIIISMYAASLVVSFIPAVFFGIPEDPSVVSALAGQRLALEGKGLRALKCMASSAVAAALFSSALFIFSLDFYPAAYSLISGNIRYLLLAFSIILVLRGKRPLRSILVFGAAGVLGSFTLESPLPDPFLPLFSGMFAVSSILGSGKGTLPHQDDESVDKGFPAFSALGVGLGMAANLLPGVGSPAQIAALATIFIPLRSINYLATISSISVSQAVFSLSSAASIGKSRNGVTAWLAENSDVGNSLGLFLGAFVLSAATAAGLVYISRKRIAKIAEMDFQAMGRIIAGYIFCITFIIDGPLGLLVLALSSLLGLAAIKAKAGRISLMGAIIVPTLMLLFGIGR